MSKLISNHETYTKLIFCERLMCGTIYTFAQKLNDKSEKYLNKLLGSMATVTHA